MLLVAGFLTLLGLADAPVLEVDEEVRLRFVVLVDLQPRPVVLTDFEVRSEDGTFQRVLRTNESGELLLSLPPDRYIVASLSPVRLGDQAYVWKKGFTVEEGSKLDLIFTDADATVETVRTRSTSTEGEIFRSAKLGVVTVQADTGHGSGFLIDPSGLIATNHHVVRDTLFVAVRIEPGLRFEARIVCVDEEHDLAILRVHEEVAKALSVLPLADTGGLPLVEEGDRVLAIGSPLNQDRIMTLGIVSKLEPTAILSDVNINPGNSGGPLLNMSGEVVGICTFLDTARQGPGISGIVPITVLRPLVETARALAESVDVPADPLPDVPQPPIPTKLLEEAAAGKDQRVRIKAPRTFDTYIETPFDVAARNSAWEKELAKRSARRDKDKPVELSPRYIWETYVGRDFDPVITITVLPAALETSASKWRGGLGALFGVQTKTELEFRYDFYDMKLMRGGSEVQPVRRNRVKIQQFFESWDAEMKDEAFAGIFAYDFEAFEPSQPIRLLVRKTPELDKWDEVKIDPKIQRNVYARFAQYKAATRDK